MADMPRALLTLLVAIVAATVYFFSRVWLPALASGNDAIDHQLKLNFILLGVVFCATQLALGLFAWKYREQQKPNEVSTRQPDVRLELAWVTLAAVLFLGLNAAGAFMSPLSVRTPIVATKQPLRLEVTGVQFRWYFRAPGSDHKFGRTKLELVDAAEGN